MIEMRHNPPGPQVSGLEKERQIMLYTFPHFSRQQDKLPLTISPAFPAPAAKLL